MAEESTNKLTLQVSGKKYTLTFAADQMRGDMLEELEARLNEGMFSWLERIQAWVDGGCRLRDIKMRDVTALVFIARSQTNPGVTWVEVANSIAPLTAQIVDTPQSDPESAKTARIPVKKTA